LSGAIEQDYEEILNMIPNAGDEDISNKGWAKIYKLLISPFSNTFKNFIQVQLREKMMQDSEKSS
jgi:hypothetical protein